MAWPLSLWVSRCWHRRSSSRWPCATWTGEGWPYALEQAAVDHELLWQVQVSGVAALVMSEVDSLVIGGALSVRALGIYSPGANFATQLSSVATNALGRGRSLGQRLRAYRRGRHVPGVQAAPADVGRGRHRLDHGGDGRRLFRDWPGWAPVPPGRLDRHRAHLPGRRPLVTALIGSYITAIGKAGALGPLRRRQYGRQYRVHGATRAVGFARRRRCHCHRSAGSGRVRAARRAPNRAPTTFPTLLRYVPLLRGSGAALTLGLEVVIRPFLPIGALGLLGAGVPALVGLVMFGVLVLGRERSECLAKPRSAVWELRHWGALSEEPTRKEMGRGGADQHAEVPASGDYRGPSHL